MKLTDPPYWHTVFLIALLSGIAADLIFGLDLVLNVISIALVISVGLMVLVTATFGLGALLWITIRDAIEGLRSDHREGRPWIWRIAAYLGILGIIVDGAVGAWNVYQQHILFSAAVEENPFAGLPVWVLLASYPIKWGEYAALRRT